MVYVPNLRQAVERLNNLLWEIKLGISTGGVIEIEKTDSCHYASVDYSIIHKVLRRLDLQPSDTFVDVGSGKGRVLCCAAQHVCRKVMGIEYSKAFSDAARANLNRLRGTKTPVDVHTGPAEEFDYRGATALYFFNPFGPATLDLVLQKLQGDTAGNPLRLAFVNPSADQHAVFSKHDWLKRYDDWDTRRGGGHSVSFYQRAERQLT
jgi:SAM-dependent methyltransferase